MRTRRRYLNLNILVKILVISLSVTVFSVLFSHRVNAAACIFTDNTTNTISVSCSVSGTSGVDNGNLVISGSGVSVTIGVPGTPATLFFTPGNSVSKSGGGSLVKAAGSSIAKEYVYYTDADNDGYGAGTSSPVVTYSASLLATPYKRRYLMTSATQADCYDLNASANPGQTGWFTTTRGTSVQGNDSAGNTWNSYDYNCDAASTQQYVATNNCP